MRRLARRTGLIVGLLLATAALVLGLSMVWRVQIDGDMPADAAIRAILRDAGTMPGVFRRDIDLNALESLLLQRLPEATWAGASLRGVTLHVDVRRSIAPPARYRRDQAGDILSCYEGMVVSCTVFEGTAAVRPGQMVKPGDVLIRGEITLRDGQKQAVQAQGEVMARI